MSEGEREAGQDRRQRRSISPLVVGWVINPVALVALWILRELDLVADQPLWAYVGVLWSGALVCAVAELWFRRRPSPLPVRCRVVAHSAFVTATIYLTGWGPALAIFYAFIAQENTVRGSRPWRVTAFWSVAWIAVGQVAIVRGWAPSLISEPLVHGVAAMNVLGVVFVVRMAAAVNEKKERAEDSLREREDRFRSLVQNSSDLILILDASGHISYASEARLH
ncbi:MAG: PAS domain-containing protein, partial [Actinomycetota bacterium]|nr:PAS domain-containing protein [Actinomycetota bacterium]